MSRQSVINLIEIYVEKNKHNYSTVGYWFSPLKLTISHIDVQLGFTHRFGKLVLGLWKDNEHTSIHRDSPKFEIKTDSERGDPGYAEEVYIRIKNQVNKW